MCVTGYVSGNVIEWQTSDISRLIENSSSFQFRGFPFSSLPRPCDTRRSIRSFLLLPLPPSLIARKSFDLFARVKATPFFDPARTSRTKEIRLKEKKKEREEKRHYKVGKEGERFAVANNVAQPWKRGARAAAF